MALVVSNDVDAGPKPCAFFLGDSHTTSVIGAARKIAPETLPFEIFASRFEKVKRESGTKIAGVTLEDAIEKLSNASADDILISLIGGNQFNAIGLMQHPEPFNFYGPGDRDNEILPGEHVIPFRVIENMFDKYVGKLRQNFLVDAQKYFKGRMFHAAPPPPKFDNEFIRTRAETMFRDRGIETFGVTRPVIRLKLWDAQIRALRRLYEPLGIGLLMPPAQSVDAHGYLKPEAYGPDATHANATYGRQIIDQVASLFDNADTRGAGA